MAGIGFFRAEERQLAHHRVPREDVVFSKHFRQIRMLGEGSFGIVYEAERLSDNTSWAIKTLHKEKAGSSRLKQIEKEVQILKMISHPSIVSLEEIFETPHKIHLVLELCELGTLERHLEKVGRYKEKDMKPIMLQLANGLAYLHRNGIVHRDVKLENVLCTAITPRNFDRSHLRFMRNENGESLELSMYVKLTDFSISALKEPDEMIDSVCGTLIYMSPEILNDRLYSQQCDVWAMGIIMYQLLSGVPPFRSRDAETLKDLICEGYLDFTAVLWKSVSELAIDCLTKLLKVDTAYRMAASEMLEHRWLNEAADNHYRPNVIELMKAFRLTQSDKRSSNGDETQSAASSSSDLQLSDQNSSADWSSGPVKSSSASSHPPKPPHNRSDSKLNSGNSNNTRTASSLSDSLSPASNVGKNKRIGLRNFSHEIDADRDSRSRDTSRPRKGSQDDRNYGNNTHRFSNQVNTGRHVSPVRYATNKRH